jgi:hypothetical protein
MIAAGQSRIGLSRAKHVGVESEGAHSTAACALMLVIVIPKRTLEQVINSGTVEKVFPIPLIEGSYSWPDCGWVEWLGR